MLLVRELTLDTLFATVPVDTELTTKKLYVYGVVPRDAAAVHDSYWPTSTIVFDGQLDVEIVGATYIYIVKGENATPYGLLNPVVIAPVMVFVAVLIITTLLDPSFVTYA